MSLTEIEHSKGGYSVARMDFSKQAEVHVIEIVDIDEAHKRYGSTERAASAELVSCTHIRRAKRAVSPDANEVSVRPFSPTFLPVGFPQVDAGDRGNPAGKKVDGHGGIRTHDRRIRSPTLYPD